MRTPLRNVLRDHYEVAVVGGGVNGAGIAQALAAAGYNVVLLERHDFGSGTTSRSTRLVHGGLRYLEHGEFSLVFESLRERAALLRLYPHLVKPIELLLPLYRGGAYPGWKARAGLALYDLLALGRGLRRHQSFSREVTLSREPRLEPAGLLGGLLFSDGQVDLAERLAVECALSARRLGADVANYADVQKLDRVSGGGLRLSVNDSTTQEILDLEAEVVINATGPWVDGVLHSAGFEPRPLIGGTRGSHIVLPADAIDVRQPIYAPARSDGRPFFVLPGLDMLLVGTTDIRHDSAPVAARATPQEIDYLLSEVNGLLRGTINENDVIYTYSGVRPLPYEEEGREGAITRRHFIVDHATDGLPGLYSLVGGKLTTFRTVGRRVTRMLKRRLGERWPALPEPPQGGGPAPESFAQHWGTSAPEIYRGYGDDPDLSSPLCAHSPEPRAALVEAVRTELATTLGDVLLRRTTIGWRSCQGLHVAETSAELVGRELGWDENKRTAEIERYQEELSRVHPTLAEAAHATSELAIQSATLGD